MPGSTPLRESLSPPLALSEGHLVSSHTLMKGGYPQRVFDHSDIRTDFRSYSHVQGVESQPFDFPDNFLEMFALTLKFAPKYQHVADSP
jgi:hypothetical protein